jgi:hypothetical protein
MKTLSWRVVKVDRRRGSQAEAMPVGDDQGLADMAPGQPAERRRLPHSADEGGREERRRDVVALDHREVDSASGERGLHVANRVHARTAAAPGGRNRQREDSDPDSP